MNAKVIYGDVKEKTKPIHCFEKKTGTIFASTI